MTQLLPDDRKIYSRYHELGSLAEPLLALQARELLFFRVSPEGVVDPHGEPAVLVVKETALPFLSRPAAVYGDLSEPGMTRIYWFTPDELKKPSTADFVSAVRAAAEPIVPPPVDEGPGPGCGSCGVTL